MKMFKYILPKLKSFQYPQYKKKINCKIQIRYSKKWRECMIIGNSIGLKYLARYILAMAMHKNTDGLHIHLEPQYDDLDKGSLNLSIYNIDFDSDKKCNYTSQDLDEFYRKNKTLKRIDIKI